MIKPKIITEHPIAYESHDHLVPKGTINDNTKNEAYVKELISRFDENMKYMDLGCAGGGFVAQFLEKGVFAVGVEGSDLNLRTKRAEWAVWPDYLFTADITKPFWFTDQEDQQLYFEAISAFDVLEHIHKHDLPALLTNINRNLRTGGVFVASIATFEDKDYHVTLEEKPWWTEQFEKFGFRETWTLKQFGRWSSICVVYEKVTDVFDV